MTHAPRHRLSLISGSALVVVVLVAACGATTTSQGPSIAPTATVAPSDTSPSSAPPTTLPPTASPSAVAPSPSASTAAACAVAPQTGRLPSDRMTDVRISTSGSADLVTFVFGNMSLPEPPQGVSDGSLEAAVPPYTQAASGLPIDVTGEHAAQIRFSGMSLANDAGEPTYDGAFDFRPDLAALRTVVNYDMSEGVIGWYIGYDGNGCVTLSSDASSVTVAIDHPGS